MSAFITETSKTKSMLKPIIELTPHEAIISAQSSGYETVHVIKSKNKYYICDGKQDVHEWEQNIYCGSPAGIEPSHFKN